MARTDEGKTQKKLNFKSAKRKKGRNQKRKGNLNKSGGGDWKIKNPKKSRQTIV